MTIRQDDPDRSFFTYPVRHLHGRYGVKEVARVRSGKTAGRLLKAFILATFITAAGTPDPLSVLLTDIEKDNRCIERTGRKDRSTYLLNEAATARLTQLFKNPKLAGVEKQLFKVKTELEKLSVKMNGSYTAAQDNAGRLAELTVRYMGVLTKLHIYYSTGVHGTYDKKSLDGGQLKFVQNPSGFSFKELGKYNLVYPKKISYPVYEKLPFYVKHRNLREFEFSLSQQEVVMAEYAALADPKDLENYGKLLQHAVLRESLVNRWSVRRLKWFNFKQETLVNKTCGYSLLSYRPDGHTIESIPVYKELVNNDIFYELANDIPKINASIKDTGLNPERSYYRNLLVGVINSNPKFKTAYDEHVRTAASKKTESEMLDDYALDLQAAEANDWNFPTASDKNGNPDPSRTIGIDTLISASTPNDDHNPVALTARMAENAFARRSQSVAEVISIYINQIMGVEDVDGVILASQKSLEKTQKEWVKNLGIVLLPQVEYLLSPGYRAKRANEMKSAKIKQALDAAKSAIQSSWELKFIGMVLENDDTGKVDERTPAETVRTVYDGLNTAPALLATINTAHDLYGFFESKISSLENFKDVAGIYQSRSSVKDAIDGFFSTVMEQSEKNKGGTLATIAAKAAFNLEYTMLLNYKLKHKKNYQKEMLNDYLEKTIAKPDALNLAKKDFIIIPEVKPDYKTRVKTLSNDAIKTALTNKTTSPPPELLAALQEEDEKRECGQSIQTPLWRLANSNTTTFKKINYLEPKSKKEIDDITAVFSLLSAINLNFGYTFAGQHTGLKSFTENSRFLPTIGDHKMLANFKISQALSAAPILAQSFTYTPSRYAAKAELKPLMYHLEEAYEPRKTGYLINQEKAHAIVTKFINLLQLDTSLGEYCNLGTARLNTHVDSGFGKMFKAATATRAALDPDGKYGDFEEKMRKASRSINEWWLEEFVYSMGWMIFFLAIFFLPAFLPAIGLISAASVPAFISFLQVVTYPFFIAGTVSRLSVNFIEQPAFFKYQQSRALSYVGDAKTLMGQAKSIVDSDGLKNEIAMNTTNKWMEVVLMPLDIWIGKLTLRDVRVITGTELIKQGKIIGLDVKLASRQALKITPQATYKASVRGNGVVTGTVKYVAGGLAASIKGFENWLVKKGSTLTAQELEQALEKKVAEFLPKNLAETTTEFDRAIEYWKLRNVKTQKRIKTPFEAKNMTLEEYAALNDLKMDKAQSWATSPNLSQFGMYDKLLIQKYWNKLMGKGGDDFIVSQEVVKRTRQILELHAIYTQSRVTALRTLKKKFLTAALNKTEPLVLMQSLTREEKVLLHDVGRLQKFFGKGVLKPRAQSLFVKGPLQRATVFYDAVDYIRPLLKPVNVPQAESFASLADDQNPYDAVEYFKTDNAYDDIKKDLNHWYYLIETFDGVNETSHVAEQLRRDLNKYFGE